MFKYQSSAEYHALHVFCLLELGNLKFKGYIYVYILYFSFFYFPIINPNPNSQRLNKLLLPTAFRQNALENIQTFHEEHFTTTLLFYSCL